MFRIWLAVASLMECIATIGAGAASSFLAYEPEVPEELRK